MEIVNYLTAHLDYIVLAIVFLSGFFQERLWPYDQHRLVKDKKYDTTLKTFFISLFFSAAYIFLVKKEGELEISWTKYFLSYFAATSLYELLIKPITKWIKRMAEKIFGKDETDNP